MSKSSNMLRTRRRDNNVKPNRRDSRFNSRLDRKSSRGMIYENEELRLKTININAEIERGQSDIKKLKRENEMLKKEIWCLRDEYDKLDRILKDKKIDFSSSSTTCSSSCDSDSCSSCSEESEEVETSQNLENVQKTNLKNIHQDFDHLSVVPEEPSTENSEKNSTRNSLPNESWNYDNGVIQPDQSYPIYENLKKSQTLPVQDKTPINFFSPIKTSKSVDDSNFNQIYPGQYYNNSISHFPSISNGQQLHQGYPAQDISPEENYVSKKIVNTNAQNFYQNIMLVPKRTQDTPEANGLEKTSTDLIVKMDNQGFNSRNETNRSIFTNTTPSQSTFSNGGNLEELLNDIETISQRGMTHNPQPENGNFIDQIQRDDLTYYQNPVMNNLVPDHNYEDQKPFKSELNVVLMPNAMPLIGFDKYKNIQRSFESLNKQPIENISASQQNLCVLPPEVTNSNLSFNQNLMDQPINNSQVPAAARGQEGEGNPFFFGSLKDNYVNSDYFNMRYNPDNFLSTTPTPKETGNNSASKSNLDPTSSDHLSSENEENLKFKTTKPEKQEDKQKEELTKIEPVKSPKMSIRRKVSIHFKGKKDKTKKLSLDTGDLGKTSKASEKKHSLFDIKFNDKPSVFHQKTPSIESKKSTTETSNVEPKTPTSSDSKNSNDKKTGSDGKPQEKKDSDKKGRKSTSVSPDRKHVHVKEDEHKKHKKHKHDRSKARRNTMCSIDPRLMRERSYSVCTDRSLDHKLSFLYDDYSDRDHSSLSSCETINNPRKMSTISNIPMNGKVPWCGCWGNGCL